MARQTEAERLRERRLTFERAMADGVSMEEARDRMAKDRWAAIEARLASKRKATGLCGTSPDQVAIGTGGGFQFHRYQQVIVDAVRASALTGDSRHAAPRFVPVDDSDDGLKWFQR
ncbi:MULTISPECIES: hypothetical protein [unclassified Sphingomonas]|jgi:hypothetical protein|uniref:hypothetical protein n=1 Tax=unclassified Sphingomonas TaxID=196159 RepID=UPI00083403B0|nr:MULTISPECIES: hypothetical protein [unclassified Sphingomonas]